MLTAEYGTPARGNTHPALPPASGQTIDLKPALESAAEVIELSAESTKMAGGN